MERDPMAENPVPAKFPLPWMVVALITLAGVLAWQVLSPLGAKGPALGSLPRVGDSLVARPYPVDDWVAGGSGTIGLKFTVAGPGLGEEFWLRFTEGAGRATAQALVEWTDERDMPVGTPFEKPFKDDC